MNKIKQFFEWTADARSKVFDWILAINQTRVARVGLGFMAVTLLATFLPLMTASLVGFVAVWFCDEWLHIMQQRKRAEWQNVVCALGGSGLGLLTAWLLLFVKTATWL